MEKRNYIGFDALLGEFRSHLRLTSNDLDAPLSTSLKAAINSAEHEISRVIELSEFTLTKPFDSVISLRYPVVDVTSVKVNGEEVPEDSYSHGDSTLVFTDEVQGESVEVIYLAGYTEIPEDIKAAVFLLGGALFNNPTDRPEERDRTTARNLLRPYRTWGEH